MLGLIGLLVAGLLAARVLSEYEWNPTALIKFGEVFPDQNEYAEKLLGDVVIAPHAGHDGKFFFLQAMDPFYLDPDTHSIYLDRPSYRAQRMLYPAFASLGGLLGPAPTAWGLVVVNVIAMGLGTAVTTLLALHLGLSRWFGLAFLLNPGLIFALLIDSAGVLAMAGLMAGIYFFYRGNLWAVAGALTAACLARETMLISVAGLGAFWLWKKRKIAWPLAVPVVAVAGWWGYVRWRLGEGASQDTQALGTPLEGFIGAFGRWLENPANFVAPLIGVVLLIMCWLLLVRAFRIPTILAASVGGFALLATVLSEPVWFEYFDSTRALAPVMTVYILLVPTPRVANRRRPAGTSTRG